MRVISGSAKGIRLTSVPGKSTRPITDQVKEALFNILGPDIIEKTLLDLFAGTGAVGIEALSRGADYVLFLDTNYKAYKIIQKNLESTNLEAYADVLKKDAFVHLRQEPDQSFDFVYIAPPQYKGLWHEAMIALDKNPDWLSFDGSIIVQIHPKEYLDNNDYTNFREFDRRDYGDTILIFYGRILSE
jgi:16S rRNA (guanine(966)-N(2))-methyltransferase RsmD